MTSAEFNDFRKMLLLDAKVTNDQKGADYSGFVDVLANFKRQGERWGLPPLKVWAVYFGKHVDALQTFVQTGKLESDSVRGRVIDCLNYLILGLALIEEKTV